jgi:two-component system OmpR family sensor kinase
VDGRQAGGAFGPMNDAGFVDGRRRSLERHLTFTLAAVILFTGIVAGGASFFLAYHDAQELQDDMLRQVAALARRSPDGPQTDGSGGLEDPETRVIVVRFARDPRPSWLPADLPAGLHTLTGGRETWRVYVHDDGRFGRLAVAQSTQVRDEIAMNGALRTVVPLAILLPVLIWLAARIVRHELAPVRELARAVDRQPAEQPEPVRVAELPEEIVPFANAINRLLERVGRLMEAQRRFVADAAHELRSPLTALSLQAQNLEQAATLEAARERVAPLRAGIERTRRMTEQLLSLARSQAAPVETRTLELGKLLRQLIADYLPFAESRGIDLGIGHAQEPLKLETDDELLRVVLKNALDNALRYTPAGGEVTLAFFVDGGDCVIEIADTGFGIPAAERERAFEPFHRLEGTHEGGTGLGLAIARDAAARLGGSVSLRDGPGGGLIFQYRHCLSPLGS